VIDGVAAAGDAAGAPLSPFVVSGEVVAAAAGFLANAFNQGKP